MILNSVLVPCCFQAHVTSPNTELSQAALQALGFCVYHSRVVSGLPGTLLYIFYASEFEMWAAVIKFFEKVTVGKGDCLLLFIQKLL